MVGQKLVENSIRPAQINESVDSILNSIHIRNLTENAVLLGLSTIKKSGFLENGTKSFGCKQLTKLLVSTMSVLSNAFRELVTIPPLYPAAYFVYEHHSISTIPGRNNKIKCIPVMKFFSLTGRLIPSADKYSSKAEFSFIS